MQELIDWMKTEDYKDALSGITMAESLIENEKKQIIDAFMDGQTMSPTLPIIEKYGINYYDKTYKPCA